MFRRLYLSFLLALFFALLATSAFAQPMNGCETCLAQGHPWWWCYGVYGLLCL